MKRQRNGAKQTKNRSSRDGYDSRFEGIERTYSRADVERLRGTVQVEHTLARLGAEKLWKLLRTADFVAALGPTTGFREEDEGIRPVGSGGIYCGRRDRKFFAGAVVVEALAIRWNIR